MAGAPQDSKMDSREKPVKRLEPEPDCAVQSKSTKNDCTKRMHNLKQNEHKSHANLNTSKTMMGKEDNCGMV